VFFASSAVPSTYSGNSMATPSFSARLAQDSLSGDGRCENRPRSATARAASDVQVEIFTPTEFLDHIASSTRAARELIQRLN
jgi:CRP-like cAMP-binding protein